MAFDEMFDDELIELISINNIKTNKDVLDMSYEELVKTIKRSGKFENNY